MPIFPPAAVPESPPVPAAIRWHGLDLLRGVAMMLGVYLHGAIPYMKARPQWPVHDPAPMFFFDFTVAAIHGFRMQLFFLLAGFFARLVAERRGMSAMLRQRAVRIGIPFCVGMLTLLPLTLIAWTWAARITQSEMPPAGSNRDWTAIPTAHLWFIEYLLFYYVAAGAVYLISGTKTWIRLPDGFPRKLSSPWLAILLPFVTMAFLFDGPAIGEVEEAGVRLLPAWRGPVYYGVYFAFGWVLHRCRGVLTELTQGRVWRALLMVLGFLGYAGCVGRQQQFGDDRFLNLLVGNYAAELYAWSASLLLIGLALQSFNRQRTWARYLADSSYWFYLAHLPLELLVQAMVAGWAVPVTVKAGTVIATTLLVLWGSYHWCVRTTIIGRVLNGRRPA